MLLVKKGFAIDVHASQQHDISLYRCQDLSHASGETFHQPDIPEFRLKSRLAIVAEMVIGADGSLGDSDVYREGVRNHAKLAYDSVASWLDGDALPPAIAEG